jgi:hypothetical protein
MRDDEEPVGHAAGEGGEGLLVSGPSRSHGFRVHSPRSLVRASDLDASPMMRPSGRGWFENHRSRRRTDRLRAVDYAHAMTAPVAPPPARARPLGVVLIAAFLVADAALAIAQRLFDIDPNARQDLIGGIGSDEVDFVVIALVVLRLVAAVGLWFGWRRGWVLTMLLVGISLILDLWLYWNGHRLYLRMAIDVVLALYLNQRAVREYFGHRAPSAPLAASDVATAERR